MESLERELLDGGRNTTRNPGDEARAERKNDINDEFDASATRDGSRLTQIENIKRQFLGYNPNCARKCWKISGRQTSGKRRP